MTAKQSAIKRCVVKLSAKEREPLERLIRGGTYPAWKLLKARMLLKADASEAGDGWSDSQIAAAWPTSVDTLARTRSVLMEEGLEAALTRKHSPHSARPRIFDCAAEVKVNPIERGVSSRLAVRQFCLTSSVMSTLTITAKAQATLRKDILKHLGVAPGEQVSVAKLPDGRIEVRAAPTGKISDIFDYLKKPGRRALSVDEMNRIAARG